MLKMIISSFLLAIVISIFVNYCFARCLSKPKRNKKEQQKGDYAFCKVRDFSVELTERKFIRESYLAGKFYSDGLSEDANKAVWIGMSISLVVMVIVGIIYCCVNY